MVLPLAAISLLSLQTLSQLSGQPHANIVFPFGKRRKRSTIRYARIVGDRRISDDMEILETFWEHQSADDKKDQSDLIMSNYISCSGLEDGDDDDDYNVDSAGNGNNRCLEHVACLYANQDSNLLESERKVISV